MRMANPSLLAVLTTGAIFGIAFTASVDRVAEAPAAEESEATVSELPVTNGSAAKVPLPDFTELIQSLRRSVVNISAVSEEREAAPRRRAERDPFEFFFGNPGPRRSLGSGFILDDAGFIITNHHVVEGASKVVVRLHNEKEHEAEVIGTDAKTDIAVIKISDVEGLAPVALGNSDSLEVGEWVLAIGNPFGLDHTVTAGIVSAKGRRINRPDKSPYDDFIQTDAAINPGNSGGPLINLAGQVVGINSAIFSRSGGNIGIGFAIPVNMAREIVPQLQSEGHVTRGWLGVLIQHVSDDIAESLGLSEAKGALVAEVYEDSPAADADIQVGDVIVKFDGQEVPKSEDLPTIVASTPVGKSVDVVVLRKGKRKKLSVAVGKLEDDASGARPLKAGELGMAVQEITPDLARELGLDKGTEGVVVSSVTRGSPADEAGLAAGDIIEMVGNEPVDSVATFRRLLKERDQAESILVLVRRGEHTLFRVIKPAEE